MEVRKTNIVTLLFPSKPATYVPFHNSHHFEISCSYSDVASLFLFVLTIAIVVWRISDLSVSELSDNISIYQFIHLSIHQ